MSVKAQSAEEQQKYEEKHPPERSDATRCQNIAHPCTGEKKATIIVCCSFLKVSYRHGSKQVATEDTENLSEVGSGTTAGQIRCLFRDDAAHKCHRSLVEKKSYSMLSCAVSSLTMQSNSLHPLWTRIAHLRRVWHSSIVEIVSKPRIFPVPSSPKPMNKLISQFCCILRGACFVLVLLPSFPWHGPLTSSQRLMSSAVMRPFLSLGWNFKPC